MKRTREILAICIAISSINAHAQNYIEQPAYEPVFYTNTSSGYIPYSDTEIEREALMAAAASAHVDPKNAVMTSTSEVNWTKKTFSSDVSMDIIKAGIPMPSGKGTSVNRIKMQLPVLVKDPLLSIYVDNSKTLGDLVLEGTITLENLTHIVDNSKQTPAVFASGGNTLLTKHTLDLKDISTSLVKHHSPYTQNQPIEKIASRSYSGIVLDARGSLPIQGEFTNSKVSPCLFPRIWSDDMNLVYERNMVNPETAKKKGIVHYSSSDFIEDYSDRVGKDPLWITVKKVYGINRCDPVISHDDYLRITTVRENLNLLREGKIVILLDKESLEYTVQVPNKNKNYYVAYRQMQRFIQENKVPDVILNEALIGIQLTMNNLRFVADSAELLPEEKGRIATIAASLKATLETGDYTVLVEGHTADVNKPNGQMTLSIQRAQSIINALAREGLNKDLFTFRGFGGTKPVADNNKAEGRALNRRVEIIIIPKGTTIMYE